MKTLKLVKVYQEYHALLVEDAKQHYSKKPYGVGCFLADQIISAGFFAIRRKHCMLKVIVGSVLVSKGVPPQLMRLHAEVEKHVIFAILPRFETFVCVFKHLYFGCIGVGCFATCIFVGDLGDLGAKIA